MSFGQKELDPDPDPSGVGYEMGDPKFDLDVSQLMELELPDLIDMSHFPSIHLLTNQGFLNGDDMNFDESDSIEDAFALDAASNSINSQNTPPESVLPEQLAS